MSDIQITRLLDEQLHRKSRWLSCYSRERGLLQRIRLSHLVG